MNILILCSPHTVQTEKLTIPNFKGTQGGTRKGKEGEPSFKLAISQLLIFFFCLLQSKLSIQRYINQEGGGKTF